MKALGVILIIVLAVGGGGFGYMWYERGNMIQVSNEFYMRLAQNQLKEAYDSTAKEFKEKTSYEAFEGFVKELGLNDFVSADWGGPSIGFNNGVWDGRIEGPLKMKDSRAITMRMDFRKEDGRWRVLGMFPQGTPQKPATTGQQTPSQPATPAQTASAPAPAPAGGSDYSANGSVPPEGQLRGMSEDTLMKFNNAVKSKDFTSFHAWLATPFREKYTADQVKDAFQKFMEQNIDISSVAGVTPSFTKPPTINENQQGKVLSYQATYSVGGKSVIADLDYLDEGGQWKLLGINVKVQ